MAPGGYDDGQSHNVPASEAAQQRYFRRDEFARESTGDRFDQEAWERTGARDEGSRTMTGVPMAQQGAYPCSWNNPARIKAEESYRKQMRDMYPERIGGSRAYGDHVTGRNNMTDFSMPRPYHDVRGATAG